ncbi:MAG: DUF6282 family protein [Chloroflexota bacterium]
MNQAVEQPAGSVPERVVNSYRARYGLMGPGHELPSLAGTVDLHLHAHERSQDPLAVARRASELGMAGILYKSIKSQGSPAVAVQEVNEHLSRWGDQQGIQPARCFAGVLTNTWLGGIDLTRVRKEVSLGAKAVWFPTVTAANSLYRVGARGAWLSGTFPDVVGPLDWATACAQGIYVLDGGKLKPEAEDMVRLAIDHDVAVFFGHLSKHEMFALAELVQTTGFGKAVIDHPLSGILAFTADEMQTMVRAGITLNFTFDEISPLLGVDPWDMVSAIRAVGPEHVTLSSDAGMPLLPESSACLQLLMVYLSAYGLSEPEMRTMTVSNPRRILGLESC